MFSSLKKIFLSVAVLLLSLSAFAQGNKCTSPDSIFGRTPLTKDLFELKATILTSHPNPYAFCTKEEFNAAFTAAAESITDSTTFAEFSKIVSKAMMVMKDSHSCVDYGFLQQVQLQHDQGLFPLNIYSNTDGYFCEKDKTGNIPTGSKLICINNIPVEDYYREAFNYSCIEGKAFTGQRRVTDAILPSVVGLQIALREANKVDFIAPGKTEEEEMEVPWITEEEFKHRQKLLASSEKDSLFTLRFGNNNQMAYMKIGSFAPSNTNLFKSFVKRSFKHIKEKGCENLIIDLRDNGGGSSGWVEYVYSYLDTNGHNTPNNIIARSSSLARQRAKLDKGFRRWVLKTFYKKDENIRAFVRVFESQEGVNDTIYFTQGTKQKSDYVFKGKCYLIINGLTASASVDFTNTFKQKKRGVVVGEPCLGPITGTFGNPAIYKLPRTGMRVSIATIRYNYDRSFLYDPLPIKPDFEVLTKISDLVIGRDTQLEFIEALILKQ